MHHLFVCFWVLGGFCVFTQAQTTVGYVHLDSVLPHLAVYDSTQAVILNDSRLFDSVLRKKELRLESSYNDILHNHFSCTSNKQLLQKIEDSLWNMQLDMIEFEQAAHEILVEKDSLFQFLIQASFRDHVLEYCQVKHINELCWSEPLYARQPLPDYTQDFILFLEEKKK